MCREPPVGHWQRSRVPHLCRVLATRFIRSRSRDFICNGLCFARARAEDGLDTEAVFSPVGCREFVLP